ncbi:MAG: Gfo/Idh/MocA family oxidoreductase [Phycisphaeraceae bacterium]
MAKKRKYNDMSEGKAALVAAPKLAYEPPKPRRYHPPIGLIGCGGISAAHLAAYRDMGLNVVALCDLMPDRVESRRKEFFPQAQTYTDYQELLKRDDIQVVDIATHPQDRDYLIPAALKAHKHVLSQKPFVLDLDKGRRFAELADKQGVTLAINQNGRWSPHWSWVRQAIHKGLIGEVGAVHMNCHWSHEWIADTHFNRVHHIVLYDYGIHWFDALASFMPGRTAQRVTANLSYAKGQRAKPPLLGQAIVEFDTGHASLVFDGAANFGAKDDGYVIGSKGTLRYDGPGLAEHQVELITKKGKAIPELKGAWFRQGFMGSMGELLCAIEQKRTPLNNPLDNLRGLAICFAAVVSGETGKPQVVGKVRKAPLKTCMVAPK